MSADLQDQTTMLADEQLPSEPGPIHLPTRKHAHIALQALEDRAAAVEHLAKKTKDEGYHRIARELLADVEMIREDLIPEVREQQELPLAGPDEATSAIANFLRPSLRRGLAAKENEEALLDRLAKRLEPALAQIYRQGYRRGLAAREDVPELAIVRGCFVAANDPHTPT